MCPFRAAWCSCKPKAGLWCNCHMSSMIMHWLAPDLCNYLGIKSILQSYVVICELEAGQLTVLRFREPGQHVIQATESLSSAVGVRCAEAAAGRTGPASGARKGPSTAGMLVECPTAWTRPELASPVNLQCLAQLPSPRKVSDIPTIPVRMHAGISILPRSAIRSTQGTTCEAFHLALLTIVCKRQ